MSKYTKEVQSILKSHIQGDPGKGFKGCPVKGLIIDVVEYPDYIALKVYQENLEEFSENDKVRIAEYLQSLRNTINPMVKCHIEGDDYVYRNGKAL